MVYSTDIIYNILSFLPYTKIIEVMWIFRNVNNVENYILYDQYKSEISNLNRRYSSHVVSFNFNNISYTVVDGYVTKAGYIKFNDLDKVNFMLYIFPKEFIIKYHTPEKNLTYIQNKIIKFMKK